MDNDLQELKTLQKQEAINRLKALGLPEKIIKDYEQNGMVYLCLSPFGVFTYLDDKFKNEIKEFEEKYDALVFFVIRDDTTIYRMDSLIYVSKYQEEWEVENEDIADGYIMTYTINRDAPFCSEFGSIAYGRTDFGGIYRRG